MPAKTVLKGMYSKDGIVKVYPWNLLCNENIYKYLKFLYYWNKVDRWRVCVAKKELNELAITHLLNTQNDTNLTFTRNLGPTYFIEHSLSQSQAEYDNYMFQEKKFYELQGIAVYKDVKKEIESSWLKPFLSGYESKLRAITSLEAYVVD